MVTNFYVEQDFRRAKEETEEMQKYRLEMMVSWARVVMQLEGLFHVSVCDLSSHSINYHSQIPPVNAGGVTQVRSTQHMLHVYLLAK